MCFYVHNKHLKEKTAKRNITCYKVFSSREINSNQHGKYVRSYYRWFNYKFGTHYELDGYINPILNSNGDPYMVNVGLHSYTSLKKAKKIIRGMGVFYKRIIVPCIIPKGSKYYYNPEDGEYVSDQIIIGKFNQIIKP